jgi:predicted TIM-barrel fold metal-dependent hydrolase
VNSAGTSGSSIVVDCDVHVAVPSIRALHPYLTEYWRDGLREAGFRQPQGIDYTFPDWSPQAIRPSDTTPDEIAARVLGVADLAVLNCCYGLEALRHPYLAAALATAVNAWLQEEWLARDERFLASMVVAVDDPDTAVAEIRRVGADPRFVQVLVAARSWEPLGRRRYWPIWEAAVEHGLAVGIHAGGLAGPAPTPVGAYDSFFEEYVGGFSLLQTQLISFIAEGVLAAHPDLRLCLLEGGVTWLPTFLWKLDTEWKGLRREIPWVRRRPSEYVREQVRMSTQPLDAPDDLAALREVLEHIGTDNMLLYASDYPHDHGSPPDRLLAVLSPAQAERLLGSNARECYRLDGRLGPSLSTAAPAERR